MTKHISYLAIELVHPQQLHAGQEAELVYLLGDLEVALEVILAEGVKDTPIYQVGGECLRQVGEATVVRPLVRHPVVVDVSSMWILAAERRGKGRRREGQREERGGAMSMKYI